MDLRFNDDEQMLHDLCTRFAKEQLAEAGAEADRQRQCPAELVEKGLELGLFLDAIPAEQDGYLEGAYNHTQRVVRTLALASGCPAIALKYEANTEFALAAVAMGQAELLKPLAEEGGSTTACTVIVDPARPLALDGGKLSGVAGAVANAGNAAWLVVVSPQSAETAYVALVPADAVSVTPQRSMGLVACSVASVEFNGTEPAALVSGADAESLAQDLRNAHKVLSAALCTGAALAGIDYAEAYAADRIQFGQPIGRFQALARLVAENRGRLHAARALVFTAAQALDHGDNAAELCQYASTVAGETATTAAIDAVQIYGGYGFVNDYPVEKIMRDVRACTTLAGDGLQEQVMSASVHAA